MNDKYFIYGACGHGKVILDIIERKGDKVIGFIDDDKKKWKTDFFDYQVIGGVNTFLSIYKPINKLIIAIGNNQMRQKIVSKFINHKINFGTAIHPSAQIGKDVMIGRGTVIMANSVINSHTIIGKHCIINTASSIDHDCTIGNYVHISPGVHSGGNVRIGDFCWIGIGSSI